jgi:hypothetical protein
MPTYQQYLTYASNKGFQPLTEVTFNYLIAARFNPITSQFHKGDSHA